MAKEKEDEEFEEQEESELEEDIEEAEEEVEEDKFVEFMTPSDESSSTALGQVATAHEFRATDLEQDLSNVVGLENSKEEDDPFKYNIGSNSEEGPKYISSGNEIERTNLPQSVDIIGLGKETNLLPNEVGFSASPTTKIGESSDIERYTSPDRFDIDKAGKDKLFEKKDVKYEPSV
jgi:hypothetical protein